MSVTAALRGLVPNWLRRARHRAQDAQFKGLDARSVFSQVYAENWWGKGVPGHYSGPGSHDDHFVAPYVEAIAEFRRQHPEAQSAVDIGCGDFNVGSKIAPHFEEYLACDVVEAVIERNREAFSQAFEVLDITAQAPRNADVFIIREVFQHLSNADIQKALSNIEGRCRFLIFTDVHYVGADYTPNVDQITGPFERRSHSQSGLDLTASPFVFRTLSETVICSVPVPAATPRGASRVMTTYLYSLPAKATEG